MKTKMTLAQSKKALISVLFLLMLVGCQKSSDPLPEVTEHINPIEEITIEEAQSWILQNDSKYSIIWNKAQHNILSPKTPPIITVPITESPKGLIKYDNVSYEPSSIYQRLLFVKINGKIEVQLMQVLPKKGIKFDNYNFQFDDFSGVILLNSISKNEITNLWIYKNGVFLKNELVNSLAIMPEYLETTNSTIKQYLDPDWGILIQIVESFDYDDLPSSLGGVGGTGGGSGNAPSLILGSSNAPLTSGGYLIGSFVMDVATIQQYPRFTSMVKDLRRFVQNNPDVLNALLQLTGYSSSEVLNSLTWGKGPKIVVEDFPAQFGQLKGASRQIAGKYLRGSDPNTIHINANWVRGIEQAVIKENYQATAFFLATVVLHEYVHEGRFQNNLSPTLCDTQKDYYSCEAGWVFSKQAFGVLITPQNAYQYSFQFFGKQ